MFLIQNTLVSLDVLEKDFCCDLDKCRGCCCIEGDAGAPLTDEEEAKIREILPVILPDMTKQCKGNPWGKTLKERSEETACKIAY